MTVTGGRRPRRWSERDREREHVIVAELARLPEDDPQRKALRDELVTMNLPLVEHLARRFRERGEAHEDLVQVGTVGLIKAVDRFDAERGVEFSTYATPTIVGEIKRHFRDRGWSVRVPRRLQEMRLAITRATQQLSQETGHSPTVAELAAHIGASEDEVLEGLEAAQAYATASLDAGTSSDGDESLSLGDTLGAEDSALEHVDNWETLKPLLEKLDDRERRIIELRFGSEWTQSQIAEDVGISQMHVSRILARTLAQLRSEMLDEY